MNTERNNFNHARRQHPSCAVAVLGCDAFDALKAEVLQCVADFFPCEQATISAELDRLKVPHFHYMGVLVLRASGHESLGYIFL